MIGNVNLKENTMKKTEIIHHFINESAKGGIAILAHHNEGDSSVSTFMMFILKDALTHAGLLPDKKRVPDKEIRLCLYKKTLYQQLNAQFSVCLGL